MSEIKEGISATEPLENICNAEKFYYNQIILNGPKNKERVSNEILIINLCRDILSHKYRCFAEKSEVLAEGGIGSKIENLRKNNVSDEEILCRIDNVRNLVLAKPGYAGNPHEMFCINHHHYLFYNRLLKELD